MGKVFDLNGNDLTKTDATLRVPEEPADAAEVGKKNDAQTESLKAEKSRAEGAEKKLQQQVDTLNAGGLNLKEDLIRTQVDSYLTQHPESMGTAVKEETERAKAAEEENAKGISQLKEEVDDVSGQKYNYELSWVNNSYVDKNGEFAVDSNWKRTEYIEIGENVRKIIFDTKTLNNLYNAFYDKDKKFISLFYTENVTVKVPDNACYFILSLPASGSITAKNGSLISTNDVFKNLNALKNVYKKNLLLYDLIENSYIRTDGAIDGHTGWSRTDYVSVKGIRSVDIEIVKGTTYNAMYDKNLNFVCRFAVNDGYTAVIIPSTVEYIGISNDSESMKTLAISKSSYESNNDYTDDECYLLRKELPSYYTDFPDEPTSYDDDSYIDGKINSVPSTNKRFVFITDVHWESNAKKSNFLMAYIRKRLAIKNVIHGGDILDFDDGNRPKAVKHMREWVYEARASLGSGLLPVQGNHDINTASGNPNPTIAQEKADNSILPFSLVEKITLDGCRSEIVQETEEKILERISNIAFESEEDKKEVIAYYKMHYYHDDNANKIRYISLLHGYNYNGIIKKYFNVRQFGEPYLQMDWLYETLMSTPENYDIIVGCHAWVNWENNLVQAGEKKAAELLHAFKGKTQNFNLYMYEEGCPVYAQGNHYYDFSNAPTVGKIICLGGDAHWDFSCFMTSRYGEFEQKNINESTILSENDILVVHTQTDAYLRTYPDGTYISNTHKMTLGTVAEQCFDIVSIENKKVTFTRIGAGVDRVFNYN